MAKTTESAVKKRGPGSQDDDRKQRLDAGGIDRYGKVDRDAGQGHSGNERHSSTGKLAAEQCQCATRLGQRERLEDDVADEVACSAV